MNNLARLGAALAALIWAGGARAGEHPGRAQIEKDGYRGPSTCEACHPGKAKEILGTVHWKHASKVDNVEHLDPKVEHGMKDRIYTMCNGNDVVNDLKEIPKNAAGKTKLTGCNTCHPGNHLEGVGSTGPAAEAAVDCLICHSSAYDLRQRKPYKDPQGRVLMGQDRSTQAALAVGKPTVKNCMFCHESAGGGVLVKRGFAFNKENDVHAARGMVCVDCHGSKDHRIPTGFDPNNWANDGVRVACTDCHGEKPHKSADYNRHVARIACQTCHIPRTGGAVAKDFTEWTRGSDQFYEPTTLKREANETTPVYAWYDKTVRNEPRFIGPHGSRKDGKSKIYPFKIYMGKAYYDRGTGQLLSMDFAPPMATGDTRAGVASAARTLGMKEPERVAKEAVPGWQTVYFGSNHLVTRGKALNCSNCHGPNGVLDFRSLGYSDAEVTKLTNPDFWFEQLIEAQKSEW
ncbi:cytochrome C [Anaeromyxobacter paludicola]|uniref:Cytochrome c n=1 Tax=Anaeromyxobacter paludicola TaxID=2918171 RepID=A0ABN6NB45_9BACT|nr:cytochrome C [Anaeromyxobacter paludicola]BDG09172.1 cytochrome c [Anaeromyxobacter paludicola]